MNLVGLKGHMKRICGLVLPSAKNVTNAVEIAHHTCFLGVKPLYAKLQLIKINRDLAIFPRYRNV